MNEPNDDEVVVDAALLHELRERPIAARERIAALAVDDAREARRPDPRRVLLEWARSGDGIEGLRARLHALGLVLIVALVGCAAPERPLVRAARIYLDLAAPVSTLTPAQADRWRAGVREWQTEAARVEEDR